MAGRLGGFHAQVTSCAELSAWRRVEGARGEVLSTALWEERTLVRTWLMRGTLHLLPSPDLMLFKNALLGRRPHNEALALRLAGVTEDELHRLSDSIYAALDGRCLTRQELARELDEPRLLGGWGSYLKPLSGRGLVCSGPPRGQETTFVRVDQWLGPLPQPEPEAARLDLLRRYLRLNGPATLADFAWWAGGEPSWARPIWSALGDELAEAAIDGRRKFMLAGDLEALRQAPEIPGIQLLGGFDPYVLGHADRSDIVDPEHKLLVSRAAGWISAVVLRHGRVVGTWTNRRQRGRVLVEVAAFTSLARPARRELEQEVAGLEGFFGVPCDLVAA